MCSLNILSFFLPNSLIIRAILYGFDYLNWKSERKFIFTYKFLSPLLSLRTSTTLEPLNGEVTRLSVASALSFLWFQHYASRANFCVIYMIRPYIVLVSDVCGYKLLLMRTGVFLSYCEMKWQMILFVLLLSGYFYTATESFKLI
jgi:hypothetical protein